MASTAAGTENTDRFKAGILRREQKFAQLRASIRKKGEEIKQTREKMMDILDYLTGHQEDRRRSQKMMALSLTLSTLSVGVAVHASDIVESPWLRILVGGSYVLGSFFFFEEFLFRDKQQRLQQWRRRRFFEFVLRNQALGEEESKRDPCTACLCGKGT